MKKIIILLLILSIISVSLISCETTENNSSDSADISAEESKPEISLPTEKSEAPDDGKITYTVTVVDENGDPIEGIILQFCDDQNCKLPIATDANGQVVGTYAEAEYHITVTDAKDYAGTGDIHEFEDGETEMTITLTKE